MEVLDVGGCVNLQSLPDSLANCHSLKLLRLVSDVNLSWGRWEREGIKWETLPDIIHKIPSLEKVIVDQDANEACLERLIDNGIEVIISDYMHPWRRKALKNCIDKYGPTYDVHNNIDFSWGSSY